MYKIVDQEKNSNVSFLFTDKKAGYSRMTFRKIIDCFKRKYLRVY